MVACHMPVFGQGWLPWQTTCWVWDAECQLARNEWAYRRVKQGNGLTIKFPAALSTLGDA